MKRIAVSIVAFLMVIAFMPVLGLSQSTFADTTNDVVKSTAYDKVLKKGKIAYCACNTGLFKVTLKDNQPKKKVRLVTGPVTKMTQKGNYLYFDFENIDITGDNDSCQLCRLDLTKSKPTVEILYDDLAYFENEYAIVGNKIYYTAHDPDNTPDIDDEDSDNDDNDDIEDIGYGMVMNLDGSDKQMTSTRVDQTLKNSSAKNYTVKYATHKGKSGYYLKTPATKYYFLAKYVSYD